MNKNNTSVRETDFLDISLTITINIYKGKFFKNFTTRGTIIILMSLIIPIRWE